MKKFYWMVVRCATLSVNATRVSIIVANVEGENWSKGQDVEWTVGKSKSKPDRKCTKENQVIPYTSYILPKLLRGPDQGTVIGGQHEMDAMWNDSILELWRQLMQCGQSACLQLWKLVSNEQHAFDCLGKGFDLLMMRDERGEDEMMVRGDQAAWACGRIECRRLGVGRSNLRHALCNTLRCVAYNW